jgi:hypothetical protein
MVRVAVLQFVPDCKAVKIVSYHRTVVDYSNVKDYEYIQNLTRFEILKKSKTLLK